MNILAIIPFAVKRYARHHARQKRPRTPVEKAWIDTKAAEIGAWFGIPFNSTPDWGQGPVPDHLIPLRDTNLTRQGSQPYDPANYRVH